MEDNACVLLRNPRSLRVMLLFLTEWGEIIEHLSFWQYSFRWQFCGKRTVSNFLWRMKVNSHFSDIKCLRRRSHNCSLCHCKQLIRSLWISIFLCKKKIFCFNHGTNDSRLFLSKILRGFIQLVLKYSEYYLNAVAGTFEILTCPLWIPSIPNLNFLSLEGVTNCENFLSWPVVGENRYFELIQISNKSLAWSTVAVFTFLPYLKFSKCKTDSFLTTNRIFELLNIFFISILVNYGKLGIFKFAFEIVGV